MFAKQCVAIAMVFIGSSLTFGDAPTRGAREYVSTTHQTASEIFTESDGGAAKIRVEDGTSLDLLAVQRIYTGLSDLNKRRLQLPLDLKEIAPGKTGALPLLGQYYQLTVRESDPENATIQVAQPGTAGVKTMHVRLLTYSSGRANHVRLCGDILVVQSGQRFAIELKNELLSTNEPKLRWIKGTPGISDVWGQDAPQSDVPAISRHSLFATNLHTHGLHVSPEGLSDNVALVCEPRANPSSVPDTLPLVYSIRPDHMAGTFWYHPHLHGSVAYQVANGMAGALLVVSKPHDRFHDLDDISQIAAANVPVETESGHKISLGRVLLFQQFSLSETTQTTTSGKNVWIVDPGSVNDRREIDPDVATNPKFTGNQEDVTTVNGGRPLGVQMKPGSIERWRLIHGGKEAPISLKWFKVVNDQAVELQPADAELNVFRIAEDGIPCLDTDASGSFVNHAFAPATLTMHSGYRSDLLIQPLKPGVYFLVEEEAAKLAPHRSRKKRFAPQYLARLEVKGATTSMSLPSVSDIARCVPPDIELNATPDDRNPDQSVFFDFVDTEQFGVNGSSFAAGSPAIVQTLGKPERWKIGINVPAKVPAGGTEPPPPAPENVQSSYGVQHPFHIHVNPFQVENYEGSGKKMWKDTFVVSQAAGPAFIRIQANDILGNSVLHCHILDHEDQGMMRRIKILPADKAQELFPLNSPRQAPESLFTKRDDASGGSFLRARLRSL